MAQINISMKQKQTHRTREQACGSSLAGWWLGLVALTAFHSRGSIPGQGTKIPQQQGQKKQTWGCQGGGGRGGNSGGGNWAFRISKAKYYV